ncbi:MAG: GTPase HflX, partial [Alteraurantiacibacter sp.]|nr:GTPase HflX [Alteraurantiacibacter sp.]
RLTQGARVRTSRLPASAGARRAGFYAHGEGTPDDDAGADERGPLRALEVRLSDREWGRYLAFEDG